MNSVSKGFGGCLGVFGAICCICVGGCVFMSFFVSSIRKPSAETNTRVSQLPPRWIAHTVKDKLTNEPVHISSLDSTNTVNLKFPYDGEQRANLTLRQKAGIVDVMFEIEHGQLFPRSMASGDAVANIRIDDTSLLSAVGASSGTSTNLCFLLDKRLPKLITTGKEMRIEVELYNETNQVFVFDLTSGR